MRVFISQPHGKERLVQAFEKEGAIITESLSDASLIVPTVDEELPLMARLALCFRPAVMVSSISTINTCRDKAEFYRFCRRHEFTVPLTMNTDLVVKPRFGKGSKGVQFLGKLALVQEYIPFPEYSVDYFAGFDGTVYSAVPRLRMNVINGESQSGKVEMHERIIEVCKRLGKELSLIGQNTIQGFWTGSEFILNEVNCRFGGGFWISQPYFNSVRKLLELSK